LRVLRSRAMAAAQLSRLQSLAQRAGVALRSQVVPVVQSSYADLMSRNAGEHLQPARLVCALRRFARLAAYVVKDPVAAEKLAKQWLFTKLARRAARAKNPSAQLTRASASHSVTRTQPAS